MKIAFLGNAMVVTSAVKASLIKAAKTFAPTALVLRNEDGDDVFAIGTGSSASLTKVGATFDGKNADGFLTATIVIGDADDKVEAAKIKYGVALANLANAEALIIDTIEATVAEVNGVFEGVTAE